MTKKEIAQEILNCVGGVENIHSAMHCVTRLRLELKDEAKLDEARLLKVEGVHGVQKKGSHYQIILGGLVSTVYDEIQKLDGNVSGDAPRSAQTNMTLPARIMDYIAGTIQPSVPVLMGAGIILSIIALVDYLNVLDPAGTTRQLLDVFGNAGLYFLPIILAFSAARKLGMNPFVGALIGGILIHPNLIALAGATGVTFIGIPMTIYNYSSTITPILLIIPLAYFVEKLAKKISPDILKPMLVPALTILITAPVALFLLAPAANVVSSWLGMGAQFIFDKLSFVGGFLLGGAAPFFVLTGVHNAVAIPLVFQELADMGYTLIFPLLAYGNIAVAGATLGVALRTKNKDLKSNAISASITGAVGITEPALFGVLLRVKKPFIAVAITGAIGGGLSLLLKVKAYGLALCGLGGLPIFFGDTFVWYCILGLGCYALSAVLSYVIGFKDIPAGA